MVAEMSKDRICQRLVVPATKLSVSSLEAVYYLRAYLYEYKRLCMTKLV